MPSSRFLGQRSIFPHPGRVAAQIAQTLTALRDAAGVASIELTDSGAYEVQTPGGRTFTVNVGVAPIGSDLARSVVHVDTGRVDTTISDRALTRAVPRALAHQLAEAAAILDGSDARVDVLGDSSRTSPPAADPAQPPSDQDARFLDPGALTPNDRGRLAELRVLESQLGSANPITRWRAAHDSAALIAHLGLVAGRPDAETGIVEDGSPDFLTRLSALTPADQEVINRLNTLPQVGSLPAAVAENWRYVTKGLLSGVAQGSVSAGALAVLAGVTANPVLLGTAVIAGAATVTSGVVTSLVERHHALRAAQLAAAVEAAPGQSAQARQLLDLEAAALADRSTQLARIAEEGTQPRSDPAISAAIAEGLSGVPLVSRNAAAPDADVEPGRPARSAAGRDTSPDRAALGVVENDPDNANLSDAARAAAWPTAGDRTSAAETIPGRGTWVTRFIAGPVAGLGVGAAVANLLTGMAQFAASPIAVGVLAIAVGAGAVNMASHRVFAVRRAALLDAHQAVQDSRDQARTRARIEAQQREISDERTSLAEQAAQRRALRRWFDQAEQALADNDGDPDGPRRVDSLPPLPGTDPVPTTRSADLAARSATLDVEVIPESSLDSDGRRLARPRRVRALGVRALAELGPRDGIAAATMHRDGSVDLRFDGAPDPIRVAVRAVHAETLGRDALVARVVIETDGSYTVELSDRTATSTVRRAVLLALDQVQAVRGGSPTTNNQLSPGSGRGPIDPAWLTAADRARVADLSRLLASLDSARFWTRGTLAAEYHAALRAAGLDLPTGTETDPDVLGSPRRRAALDPELLSRIEARDPLPSTAPSLWVHQRKWLGAAAVPAVSTPTMLALAAAAGVITLNPFTLGLAVGSPLVVGLTGAIGDWALSRSQDARQQRIDAARRSLPDETARAREETFHREEAARLATDRARASAADQALAQRRARFEAALAREARNRALDQSSIIHRIIDSLLHRTDPIPVRSPAVSQAVETPSRPTASATAAADLRARAEAAREESAAEAAATDAAEDGAPAEITDTARRAKPRLGHLIGVLVVPATAAAGLAIGVATAVAGVPLLGIFKPAVWAALSATDLGVVAAALTGSAVAAISALSVVGERLVAHRNADLQAARAAAQEAYADRTFDAARHARLAPLRSELAQAEARAGAVATLEEANDARQARALTQAVPLRGRGPLRALADLFGGARPESLPPVELTTRFPGHDGGMPDGAGTPDGGPPDGGPDDSGGTPANGGPQSRLAAAVEALSRAAGQHNVGVVHDGGGRLSLTTADGVSVPAGLTIGQVTGGAPVAISTTRGAVIVTVDQHAGQASSERALARAITAELLANTGVPQGDPLLSRAPLSAGTAPGQLTVADHQALAEITELLHQIRTAGPVSRAALDAEMIPLLDATGLRLGAADAAARRAMLPPALLSDLESGYDGQHQHNEMTVRQAAVSDLAGLSRAVDVAVEVDPAEPTALRLRYSSGEIRTVGVQIGTHPSGMVATAERTADTATVTLDGRSSSTAAQIALAGALAELIAGAEGAPADGRTLRPDRSSGPPAPADLTVADRRGLAELRMADRLSDSAVRTTAAQRWHSALAHELGLHGVGDGPVLRRGVLSPAEERAIAGRFELDEVVLARQYVEAAAALAQATPSRLGTDRVRIVGNGRELEVLLRVEAADPDAGPRAEVRVEDAGTLRVTVSRGADIPSLTLPVSRLVMTGLTHDLSPDQAPDPATSSDQGPPRPPGPPSPPQPGRPESGDSDRPRRPAPDHESEDARWDRLRKTINITGWDDEEPDEWCRCEPGQPCTCGRPTPVAPPGAAGPPASAKPDEPPATDGDDSDQPPPSRNPSSPSSGARSGGPDAGSSPQERPGEAAPNPGLGKAAGAGPSPNPVPTPVPSPVEPPRPPPTVGPPAQGPPAGSPYLPPGTGLPPPETGEQPPGDPGPAARLLQMLRRGVVLHWACPDGGHIDLLIRLVPRPGGGWVVVLSELPGSAPPTALRRQIERLIDAASELIGRAGGLGDHEPCWLVHDGPFSVTSDPWRPECLYEIQVDAVTTAGSQGPRHRLAGVIAVPDEQVSERIEDLRLAPVEDVLAKLDVLGQDPVSIPRVDA